MSDPFKLLDLLNATTPSDATLGWRAGQAIERHEFLDSVHGWQAYLKNIPGQNFALYFTDSIAFACALLGAWQAGKTIYLPADVLPATCAALSDVVDGYLGEFPSECMPLQLPAEGSGAPSHDFHALAPEFVGLVVYTSGSTGAAQAIPKKISQLAVEVATLEKLFGEQLGAADIVATVSHQHIYGLLFKVLWPLTSGRAIQARSIAYPEELAQVLGMRAAVLISSPAHLKRLPDLAIWKDVAPGLRAVFSSGGPLLHDDAQAAARLLGQMPIEIYGSSETGGIAWRKRESQATESWTPLPGVSWRIAAEEDVLEVCSAHLPDSAWLRLTDRAQPENDERFLLLGRIDRIVKIEEKRISLDAIENQLLASPLVDQARVLVVDGNSQSQTKRPRIAAFIVPSAQGRMQLDEKGKLACNRLLSLSLSHAVESIALPRSWRYLDALPVNAQGKTTRLQLLALLDDVVHRPRLPRQRLLEKESLRVVFELTAPQDLLYFDGHFPGMPILAGVVQIDWVISFARSNFDMPPRFRGIHALKFQRVIKPEMLVKLELTYEPSKATLTFNFYSDAGQHACGRILFGATDV